MDLKELKNLVRQGENLTLEFKRKVVYPEKIIREMVAFSNSRGGYLLIGVDDDGSIPGLKHAEEDDYALRQSMMKWCKPRIQFDFWKIPLNEKKSVLCYRIKEGKRKPHVVKASEKEGKNTAYVRVEDKSVQASRELREILKRQSRPRNIRFHYGEKEQLLMRYLDEKGRVTVEEFKQLASLNRFQASKTLVLLVLANVLGIQPSDKGDYFFLKPHSS